jgi:hypothetical protein
MRPNTGHREPAALAPGQGTRARARIGPGLICVADVGGEKLDVARQAAGSPASVRGSVRRIKGRHCVGLSDRSGEGLAAVRQRSLRFTVPKSAPPRR